MVVTLEDMVASGMGRVGQLQGQWTRSVQVVAHLFDVSQLEQRISQFETKPQRGHRARFIAVGFCSTASRPRVR